jgi:phospholipid/cholesterol/gamma-HCH transport system permease protein
MDPKRNVIDLQNFYLLSIRGVAGILRRPLYVADAIEQMAYAGYGSLPIISAVSLFVGMALSLQIAAEFAVLGLEMYTGRVVGIAIISEIGPVLSAVIYAGRVGSGMASELGSMALRNQVAMLRVFGVDPVKKLVTPRLISSFIMLPALTFIGDFVAILGGAYIVILVNQNSATIYWSSIRASLLANYVVPGTIKPFIFGLIIASVSCYTGFAARGGAAGLKSSTTRAFVLSTIAIIIADFMMTKIILRALGA